MIKTGTILHFMKCKGNIANDRSDAGDNDSRLVNLFKSSHEPIAPVSVNESSGGDALARSPVLKNPGRVENPQTPERRDPIFRDREDRYFQRDMAIYAGFSQWVDSVLHEEDKGGEIEFYDDAEIDDLMYCVMCYQVSTVESLVMGTKLVWGSDQLTKRFVRLFRSVCGVQECESELDSLLKLRDGHGKDRGGKMVFAILNSADAIRPLGGRECAVWAILGRRIHCTPNPEREFRRYRHFLEVQ